MFFLSKHFVIGLYIFEIAASGIVLALAGILQKRHLEYKYTTALGGVMVARLIIKLLYFYVEFYIAGWPLNALMNFSMDSTYVLSMLLSIDVLSRYTGSDTKQGRSIRRVAALCYVFIWMAIELFAVDRTSNHHIIINGSAAQIIYFANEVFFFIVFLSRFIFEASYALRKAAPRKGLIVFFATVCSLYISYVLLWDIQFVYAPAEFIQITKPFDFVLLFSFGFFVFFFFTESKNIGSLLSEPAVSENPSISFKPDFEGFAKKYALTGREQELVVLVFEGKSNCDIAEELFISENTVKRHLTSVYKKTNAKNRTQLICAINAQSGASEE